MKTEQRYSLNDRIVGGTRYFLDCISFKNFGEHVQNIFSEIDHNIPCEDSVTLQGYIKRVHQNRKIREQERLKSSLIESIAHGSVDP